MLELNRGIAIGQVSPEAAQGGPIGWVDDGDRVVIDVAARRVTLEVPDAELDARRARPAAQAPARERGWLSIYEQVVQPITRGAALVPDEPRTRP